MHPAAVRAREAGLLTTMAPQLGPGSPSCRGSGSRLAETPLRFDHPGHAPARQHGLIKCHPLGSAQPLSGLGLRRRAQMWRPQPWPHGPRACEPPPTPHTLSPLPHCRLVIHRLGRQDESAGAGGGGMRVLQIPAIPLDRMWGHGPVPPLEGALELLHEQAARQHAQRNPGVCTATAHARPHNNPRRALCMGT